MRALRFQSRSLLRSAIRPLTALIVAGVMLGAVRQARADDFFAIIANLTNAKQPQARFDVGIDTRAASAGTDIEFTVFNTDGVQLGQFTTQTLARGFGSSALAAPPNDNLFSLSAGLPALVRARTPSGATISYAMLRQTLKTLQINLGVPPEFSVSGDLVAAGTIFDFVLGDTPARATLLIGNVSGADATVDVFIGTTGAVGTGKYSIPRLKNNGSWIVDLAPADAQSHLVISSTGNIIAQLAIDYSRIGTALTEITLVPPF
jgi:hypothetical protein